MSAEEQRIEHNSVERRKLRWLIFGRLIVATLLLFAGVLWARGSLRGRVPSRNAFIILSVIVGVTYLYALGQRFSKALTLQVRVQFIVDIFLVTWLVWISGDVRSPYIALYIVIISLAS